jgi:hypothetical protein
MNLRSGVYIFRSSYDIPTILAYKKRENLLYLTLVYRNHDLKILELTWSNLLDIIPINSRLLGVYLPILSTIPKTIEAWVNVIIIGLYTH